MVMPVEGVFHNLVIVKIDKEYPGQALKVMHSLWGAGQMMFTKMMIIVDGEVDIHDSLAVAKVISDHTDPATDILFTHGPADVLDHSCSRMAFGGKVGIDATAKLPEETGNRKPAIEPPAGIDPQALRNRYPEIVQVNDDLLKQGISLVFVSVDKNRKDHIKELTGKLFAMDAFRQVKMLLFLEPAFDISRVSDAVWRFANNVDPMRDHIMIPAKSDAEVNHVAFDGTRKTKAHDGFDRDWPNILVSDERTIARIDEIWDNLGLGNRLESPSARYRKHLYKGGAVAE